MNSEQCVMMMTAMKSACQSEAEFFSALTQMSSGAEAPALKAKKSKKAEKAEKASDAQKAPTAWNVLVTQTVSEMKQSGWESWTDLKGTVWPASLSVLMKNKTGLESEQFVFSSGEHEGKQPSPALGGMARASYLKAQSDPEHAAKVSAYHAKLAEKRSAAASVASAEGSDAEAAPVAVKKSGRPPMTEEQKAAAKLKRAIKKAAEAEAAASAPPASSVPLRGEWAEMEQNEQKEKEE